MNSIQKDAETFAEIICKTKFKENILAFGHFLLKGKEGVISNLIYFKGADDLIRGRLNYTYKINDGDLELSLQLWLNVNNHYKFRAITRINNEIGYVFSVNLTTQKESESIIYLLNKIKFSEKYEGDIKIAKAYRRQKQIVFADILRKLNIDVTENNDIILGIFDPKTKSFANTTAEKFLQDFLVVSILKGHFMGNKGYNLELLPTYKPDSEQTFESEELVSDLPLKIKENKSKRTIPLSFRYKVLKRDNFKCVACGRNPKDNIKLHIDHKIPYSLGGMTEMKNLQTLCDECNISKSNKFIDK